MLIFHIREILFRSYYYLTSLILTFILLFYNKENLLLVFAPLDLFYHNVFDIFINYFIFILLLSFLLNIPYFFFQILYFFKSAIYKPEYYNIKKYLNFFIFIFLIYFFISFNYILFYVIKFSYFFNSEQITMQITFESYINLIIQLFYFLIFNICCCVALIYKLLTRINIYLFFFIFLLVFSNLEIFNLIFLFLNFCFIIESIMFLYYLYFNKGL